MRRTFAVMLAATGLLALAAGESRAQSPIGLYGSWSSSRFAGAGGQIQLSDIVTHPDGSFVGRVFFTGSPCATWGNFSGQVFGNTATLSMMVGNCGLDEVTLQRQGPGSWVGTYRSQFPDEGTVVMTQ
jgi:hypothetical protein